MHTLDARIPCGISGQRTSVPLRKLAYGCKLASMPTTEPKRLIGPMSRRLRDARTGAGLSRRELAKRTGLAERTINYYESPKYARARKASFVQTWATACGRTFEEIWGTASEQPSRRFGCSSRTAAHRRVA